jgi:hypothetical protein
MSPVREASLTALREIRRNLGSTKGIAMFALFFLGGLVPRVIELVLMHLVDSGENPVPEEVKRQFFEQSLLKLYENEAVAKHLAACPPMIFGLFRGTLLFVPLFVLFIGFDQVAGDVQHRAIRYVAGRSRRESMVAGKALGVWAVISTMMLVLNLVVWILAIAQKGSDVGAILAWGPRMWLFCVAGSAAYVGLVALISSFFRTPIVALFAGAGVMFVLWLTNTILGLIESTKAATWAFPSSYQALVVSPEPLKVVGGLAAFIGWGAVMVLLASLVVKRRDI